MDQTAKPPTAGTQVADPEDRLTKIIKGEPHRAFTPDDLVRLTDPKTARDPQKLAEASKELKANLDKLSKTGEFREIESGLFKARLFFDQEKYIEHAYIGGMGNTQYGFPPSVFRLNIGVLSVFFIKDEKRDEWIVTVRDTTIGKDYCLTKRLPDNIYVMGSRLPEKDEDRTFQISGRYIEKKHVTIALSKNEIRVEDHRTLNGTRVDHLTQEGLARYQELAKEFLKQASPLEQVKSIKRGRFVLERLLKHHQNFEAAFFGAVVDSVLMNG